MLACLRNKLRTDSLAVWFFLLSLASVSMLIPYGNVPFQLIQNSGVKLFQSQSISVLKSEKHDKQDLFCFLAKQSFMSSLGTQHNVWFLCLKMQLQHVHGQSVLTALYMAYLASQQWHRQKVLQFHYFFHSLPPFSIFIQGFLPLYQLELQVQGVFETTIPTGNSESST